MKLLTLFKRSRTHRATVLLGLPIGLSALFACSALQAKELPLWELGLGLGGLHQPYYVGTKQTRSFAFPVPVPIYRGHIFKSDEEGVRALLLNNDRARLEMSLDFNLAIDSGDVDLRAGMPDIDSRLQIGPSLELKIAETDHDRWLVNLPVRANFGVGENGIDESGFTFAPNVTYFRDFEWKQKPWRAGIALGPQFGTREYQNVYYGVEEEFATEARPAFEADSGYSGSRLLMTLRSKNADRLWVWFLRYENISGASFEDSPLVETNDGLSVGIIYSRFLFRSKQMITRNKRH
ncbi:MipA/OmpV family protein [Arenicella xantha]|uniref:Outer membrane scaffolding protein for murein synthesis (MipA/OmpV family) n=1 Tax=Arenicella xantha TaxID=644221 RepID=A0A395JQ46_9GAMM|nr:MipA/OmpV family protein [Arenicella xantha]RBP53729.1 outer membrane scaffolding protein for murein synthesis (MipA/OmpV family) [Arenicella xantha]